MNDNQQDLWYYCFKLYLKIAWQQWRTGWWASVFRSLNCGLCISSSLALLSASLFAYAWANRSFCSCITFIFTVSSLYEDTKCFNQNSNRRINRAKVRPFHHNNSATEFILRQLVWRAFFPPVSSSVCQLFFVERKGAKAVQFVPVVTISHWIVCRRTALATRSATGRGGKTFMEKWLLSFNSSSGPRSGANLSGKGHEKEVCEMKKIGQRVMKEMGENAVRMFVLSCLTRTGTEDSTVWLTGSMILPWMEWSRKKLASKVHFPLMRLLFQTR